MYYQVEAPGTVGGSSQEGIGTGMCWAGRQFESAVGLRVGPRAARRRARAAFTLVELLVVTAILLALLCVLVPSLRKAAKDAGRVVCANNLRQLGSALTAYACEHNRRYPVEELCGNPQDDLIGALFGKYVQQRDLFYCPSAETIEPYAQSEEYGGPGGDSVINTDHNWSRHYITYKYFSMRSQDARMPTPLELSEYPHLLTAISPGSRWLMSDWVRKDAPVFAHQEKGGYGGGRNVLFADVSVRFVRHKTRCAFTDEK